MNDIYTDSGVSPIDVVKRLIFILFMVSASGGITLFLIWLAFFSHG